MADVSRRMKRLVQHLEAQGVRVRVARAGWVCYPPGGGPLINIHTSPKSPTGALHTIRRKVEAAGLDWPETL